MKQGYWRYISQVTFVYSKQFIKKSSLFCLNNVHIEAKFVNFLSWERITWVKCLRWPWLFKNCPLLQDKPSKGDISLHYAMSKWLVSSSVKLDFLVACTRLYTQLCLSIHPSVGWFISPTLKLFFNNFIFSIHLRLF